MAAIRKRDGYDWKFEAEEQQRRVATLEAAIRDLKREHEAPVPDYALRRELRDKLFSLVQ